MKKPKKKTFVTLVKMLYQTYRIPFSALRTGRASLTVEASLVLPVFIFAMLSILYLGKMMECQDRVQWALTRVASEVSVEYAAGKNQMLVNTAACQTRMSRYLDTRLTSFHMLESKILRENDEIDLIICYRIKTPFHFLPFSSCQFRQRVHTRAFTGVESREQEGKSANSMVYITPTGRVYHKSSTCHYLKLSISQFLFRDIHSLRNENGGIYKPCEHCLRGQSLDENTPVFITNYGDRYHASASCSKIKRSIEKISLSEVGERTPCSKCAK